MDAYFTEMLRRIKPTEKQQKKARVRYSGVAETLHKEFYDTTYNGSTKLLMGSYGKHTTLRPPKDIDLVFKIPEEVYAHYSEEVENGPSALLSKIREVLSEKYTTTENIKAWGKVVLVDFSNGYSVEVLPGYEVSAGVFMIPDTYKGGSWSEFDVGADLRVVSESQAATGITTQFVRYVKRWKLENKQMTLKGFELEKYVADFLQEYDYTEATWSKRLADFFVWLSTATEKDATYIDTAVARSEKARAFELKGDALNACGEWLKVFGSSFPAYEKNKAVAFTLTNKFPAPGEEYIEDMYPVRINPGVTLAINDVVKKDSFLERTINQFFARYGGVPKNSKIEFSVSSNAPSNAGYYWKVRNFGAEAFKERHNNGLRGQVVERGKSIMEPTKYKGDHYVECYVIVDDICVARKMRFVPIRRGED